MISILVDLANTDDDNELSRKVQEIVLFYLFERHNNNQDVVSLSEIQARIAAVNPALVTVDIVKLFMGSDWVEITDSNDFRISREGINEAFRRGQFR